MYLTLALLCWHVWSYVHRSIQYLFTWQMFPGNAVQWYTWPHTTTVNTTLCVYWLRFTRVCHFSKQFTMHRPTSHFLQKYSVLRVCLCSEHTRHRRCFPLEGQCCECFTSSRLSWDTTELGLPLEMPLAVTFSSCEWIINSRTRISRKFLCVILPPHDLCIRNAFRMVMSISEKTVSWPTSIAVDHSVWLVHKPHVCIIVFYNTRFDSLAGFLGEISFNRGSVHVCQNVHILSVFPANSP